MNIRMIGVMLSMQFVFQLLGPTKIYSQVKLHTEDLPRFYQALDSVMTSTDSLKQLAFIQSIYVDKASAGLKEFMKLRGGKTKEWLKLMTTNRAALLEKRQVILSAINQQDAILDNIKKLAMEGKIINSEFGVKKSKICS